MKRERKVPRRRFREFQNDEGWKYNKFKDVFDLLKNNTVSRDELNYEKGSVKNVHYGDVLIKYGDYIDVSKTKLPYFNCDKIVKKFASSLLQDGDIVIADTAEDETVGKCTEIQGASGVKLVSGLHTIPCRPKVKFAPKYLGYYINSYSYHDQLIPLMQGTKVTSISKSAIKETDMLIPKLIDEQRKIGEYLSNIDNIITLNQCKLEKLKALKKAYLTQMFPSVGESKPKLRFAGFDDEWEQHKLGGLISYIVDNRGRNPKYYYKEGIPVIDNFMIKNNCYPNLNEATRFLNEYLFNNFIRKYNEPNDILITLVGNGIGNITLAPFKKCVIIQNTLGLRFSNNKKFMYYLLLSINKNIKLLDRGMAQPSIRQDELLDIWVYLPSSKEQKRITDFLYNIDKIIDLCDKKVKKLQNLKKAYLNEMFI